MSYWQMVNFPTWIPDCDSHSPGLLDFFLSSDASISSTMALPPLENSNHIVFSVSIDFPANSQRDAPFHGIGGWKGIFKFDASAAVVNFLSGSSVELMYISLISLHGFQLLVLLP